ncbi:MAG: endonuclease IV [Bacillus thermozeamaize]|uniref:Probable endonuclease 4 n=1 Tax=Bacillus thermozeamaize TaxID=230954 RepID=A0A1Y3PNT0_9BACI|nr:MAG: endonuclease IV [Bacillus thermozeamaize]
MKLGCHISVAQGFAQAARKAVALGAESFQVFTKSPRSLKSKKVDVADAEKGVAYCKEQGLSVITHTPYITNLSTPDPGLQEATIRSLQEDLIISGHYGAIGAVVHCGKHVGEGEELGIQRMIDTINRILDGTESPALLLLENTAGQGSELGKELETLVRVREAVEQKDRLGFCFDTCHSFAAGLWQGGELEQFLHLAKETGYLPHVKAVHLNDSKAPYDSRKDRHEKIGQGEIGLEAILDFLESFPLSGMPVVLETPVQREEEYADEMEMVRRKLAERSASRGAAR